MALINVNGTNSNAKVTKLTSTSNSKRSELNGAAVEELMVDDQGKAKKLTSSTKSSAQVASSSVKKILSKSNSTISSHKTVPDSGDGGSGSRIGDLFKDGAKGVEDVVAKSKADTQAKIETTQPKDNAEISSGSGFGGGAQSLGNTLPGTNPALGQGAVGNNFGAINNNFGQQVQNNVPPSVPPVEGWGAKGAQEFEQPNIVPPNSTQDLGSDDEKIKAGMNDFFSN